MDAKEGMTIADELELEANMHAINHNKNSRKLAKTAFKAHLDKSKQ